MSLFHHLFLPHHSNNQRAKILHPSSLSVIIGLFALFQIGLAQLSASLPDILGYASQIPPDEIVRLTNAERATRGLPELKLDSKLSSAAGQKAADMLAKNYWAHVSPSGTQPWFFITQSGYSYRFAGENLARDFSDSHSVVTAWLNSPTHRDNLLSSKYQDIGVAVVDGQLEGRETTLVVQLFGTQLASSPQVADTGSTSLVAAAQAPTAVPVAPTGSEPTPSPLAPSPSPLPPVSAELPQSGVFLASTSQPSGSLSPFEITKYVSLGLLVIFVLVLLADVAIINRKKIVRWTSKSFAHLVFIFILLIAMTTVLRGRII